MVTGSRTSGNRGVGLDDEAKKMIQSIKEVVDSHSDADIYTALKEANMDANEAVEKLIHQGFFSLHLFFCFPSLTEVRVLLFVLWSALS
jgi:hypothetical protein